MYEGTTLGDPIEEQEYLKEEHALQQSLELAQPPPLSPSCMLANKGKASILVTQREEILRKKT
jgi:hypothetical protein